MLAESGRISESRALLDGLLRDDTDNVKSILDRQTFYRHELVADVLRFVQQHIDPVAEAVKNENTELQEQLQHIREHGFYRQFTGHKKLFDQNLETLFALRARRERSPISIQWHRDVNASYHRLTEIEADAAKASAATRRFASLTSARDQVSQFLDSVLSRARAITLDAARHPLLHMEVEKIKAHLSEITSPDSLHATCDLTINFLDIRLRAAESAYREASESNILLRGRKRTSAADSIAAALANLRNRIEKLRFEKMTEPFQICPSCFATWPRGYKHCGQCRQELLKRVAVE